MKVKLSLFFEFVTSLAFFEPFFIFELIVFVVETKPDVEEVEELPKVVFVVEFDLKTDLLIFLPSNFFVFNFFLFKTRNFGKVKFLSWT